MKKLFLAFAFSILLLSACAEVKEEDNLNNDILSLDNSTEDLIKGLIDIIKNNEDFFGSTSGSGSGSGSIFADDCIDAGFGNSAGFGDSFFDGFGYGCSLFKAKPE